MAAKRIVLATFGTIGDLFPLIGLALGLKARGHAPVIASTESLRGAVEAAGLRFAAMGPAIPEDPALYARIFDPKHGLEFTFRHMLLPAIRESYEDLARIAEGASLIIGAPNAFAAPLVAARAGIPWIATLLQPSAFVSAHDPPVVPCLGWGDRVPPMHPRAYRLARDIVAWFSRSWFAPLRALRRELGLPPGAALPFERGYAPALALALFSPVIGAAQPDWPQPSRATGFIFYERALPVPPALAAFLERGPPPLVFTLGSFALTTDAARFYAESLAAARALGRRAVLLVGRDENRALLPDPLPEDACAVSYAPYGAVFPRAAAVIHRGGIGATAWALRAARPMLVVPVAFDQPDNAARVARLGVARVLAGPRYRADRASRMLAALLGDPAVAAASAAAAARIAAEDGPAAACDAIETVLRRAAG